MKEGLRRGSRILVTGGAGFIGSVVVRRLLAEGFTVRVLDDFSHGRRERLDGLDVELVSADLRSERVARDAVAGMDGVIHLASRRAEAPREERLAHDVNVTGTLNLLAASRDAEVKRFVYASSSSVYGGRAPHLLHEDLAAQPQEIDGAFKMAAENYVRLFATRDGLQTTILRLFSTYGAEQEEGVVACFVYCALAGESLLIEGDGTQTRDLVHVEDVAAAFVCTLLSHAAVGRTLNIASGEAMAVRTVAGMISDLVAGAGGVLPPPRYVAARPRAAHDLRASVAAAASSLGWRARIKLREGLAACLGVGPQPAPPPLQSGRIATLPPVGRPFPDGSATQLPTVPSVGVRPPPIPPPPPVPQPLFGDRPPSWNITDEAEISLGLSTESTRDWAP